MAEIRPTLWRLMLTMLAPGLPTDLVGDLLYTGRDEPKVCPWRVVRPPILILQDEPRP